MRFPSESPTLYRTVVPKCPVGRFVFCKYMSRNSKFHAADVYMVLDVKTFVHNDINFLTEV